LTKAEQNAIAEDKARWAVAIKWFRDKQQARIKLAELTGHAHDDMRRRLNVLRIGL
jgi:hypothetical protein